MDMNEVRTRDLEKVNAVKIKLENMLEDIRSLYYDCADGRALEGHINEAILDLWEVIADIDLAIDGICNKMKA